MGHFKRLNKPAPRCHLSVEASFEKMADPHQHQHRSASHLHRAAAALSSTGEHSFGRLALTQQSIDCTVA